MTVTHATCMDLIIQDLFTDSTGALFLAPQLALYSTNALKPAPIIGRVQSLMQLDQ